MNNKNEDQLPRWIYTIRRSFSPYPQTMSDCECGHKNPAVGGGMCRDNAYAKIVQACGLQPARDFMWAVKQLHDAQIKYDEYQSKQTKS